MRYKKIIALAIAVSFISIVAACALLTIENPNSIPLPYNVNTNSKYFVDINEESITFTGDPEADFTAARLLFADPANDSAHKSFGTPSTNFHEIVNIYMAFTKNNLYIGFKSPSYPDGTVWNLMYSGGSYIFIDNGITSGSYSAGPLVLNNAGLSSAGIAGQLGNFDQAGIIAVAPHKFSLMLKHYRPVVKDMPVYQFISGAVVRDYFSASGSSIGWNNYTQNGCTEVAIPLHYIFGDSTTNIGTFYMAFRIDGALTENNVSDKTNAAAIDWAPFNVGDDLTNWLVITNLSI